MFYLFINKKNSSLVKFIYFQLIIVFIKKLIHKGIVIINLNNFFFLESEEFAGEEPKINQHDDRIKPHEQRVLNFLVNEYLMQHNYKLTSITFADENENQVNYYIIILFINTFYKIPNG